MQIVVMAEPPVPGRLCPPCTPVQAAALAAAALADTLATVTATPAMRRTLVLNGQYDPPPGWCVRGQRGHGPREWLANAFVDTAIPGMASLLIGVDTPQITPALLDRVALSLGMADAVIGPAEDGGWWLLALRDPAHARILRDIPTSTADTHALTVAALLARRLIVHSTARLRGVDSVDDARAVARACPYGRFAEAVARHLTGSDVASPGPAPAGIDG